MMALQQDKLILVLSEVVVLRREYGALRLMAPGGYSEAANVVNNQCGHLLTGMPEGARVKLTLRIEQLPPESPQPKTEEQQCTN
jgi:hypothetical protein